MEHNLISVSVLLIIYLIPAIGTFFEIAVMRNLRIQCHVHQNVWTLLSLSALRNQPESLNTFTAKCQPRAVPGEPLGGWGSHFPNSTSRWMVTQY